jgi:predicted GIY-YIG superfamily endonuclease
MFVYCLATVEEPIFTYVGATVDLERRLDQHNQIYVGGAKATSKRPGGWYRVCYVSGFSTWRQALSFEWHWKYFGKRLSGSPLDKRRVALDKTLLWGEKMGMEGLVVNY